MHLIRPKEQTMNTTNPTWITWRPNGRDPYHNPKSGVAHAVSHYRGARAYYTACGRYVDGEVDAVITISPNARRCKRCEKAQAQARD